jgi:hypothetical protein
MPEGQEKKRRLVEIEVTLQGGKDAEFEVAPEVTVGDVRRTAMTAFHVVEVAGETWVLSRNGEVLNDAESVASVLERTGHGHEHERKLECKLIKHHQAG